MNFVKRPEKTAPNENIARTEAPDEETAGTQTTPSTDKAGKDKPEEDKSKELIRALDPTGADNHEEDSEVDQLDGSQKNASEATVSQDSPVLGFRVGCDGCRDTWIPGDELYTCNDCVGTVQFCPNCIDIQFRGKLERPVCDNIEAAQIHLHFQAV